MPSAQRARIEAALKARRGDNGRYVPKVCVTAASLRKSPALGLRREADCKRTRNVRTPHGWQFQQVCRRNGRKQTMDIRYRAANRETIEGTVNIAMHEGTHDVTMKQVRHRRWLSPDCGKVKPVE